MREHVLELFFGEEDLVNGLTAVFEGHVVAVDVGGEEDFCQVGHACQLLEDQQTIGRQPREK